MLNLIGVFIAFTVVIFLIRKKYNFGLSLILGSIIVGIFSLQTISLIDIPKAMIEASFYSFKTNQITTYTIELAILMTVIFTLAKLMQETGAITKLINSLRTIFSKGGTLAVIPAVYGLMPVPGGALFSAPSIDEEGNKFCIDNNQKNFLNVWFRHIWFPIYPISSAMILICSTSFSNLDIYQLVLVNTPAFLATIIIGLFYLRNFLKENNKEKNNEQKKDYSGLIYLLPPIVPLFFYAILQFFGMPQVRSFLIGMIFSIILLYFLTKKDSDQFLQKLKKSLTWKLAVAIFGIMIFREIFEISGAATILGDIIGGLPFPSLIIIILIPLVLGLLTGYNLGAVVLSYPLVEPFFNLSGLNILGLTSIIFISSLVGYLISPIHLCNVLSSDYLKTDTTRMYKMYIPSGVFMLIVQTIFIIVFLHI